ncbi:hypothetical protein [Streptomyces sp.]|uniref:hypothetical protein n=1 Tax=Streptomyces sp. TaxID=1931 RepID=UPI002F95F43B
MTEGDGTPVQDDDDFAQLRKDFPGWDYWRAHDSFDNPTSWMATRVDPTAGVDRTLMSRDEPGLRVLLARQKDAVESGTGVAVSAKPDAFWGPSYL